MINGHTRLCAGHSNCSHQMSKFYVQVQKSVLDLILRLMANTAFSTIIVFKLLKQTHRCWASSFHNKKDTCCYKLNHETDAQASGS